MDEFVEEWTEADAFEEVVIAASVNKVLLVTARKKREEGCSYDCGY